MASAKEAPRYSRAIREKVVVNPIQEYFNYIAQLPELTENQEVFLSQQIERGRVAKTILSLIYPQERLLWDTPNLPLALVGQKESARIQQESVLGYLKELGLSEDDVEVITTETTEKINKRKGKFVVGRQQLSLHKVNIVKELGVRDPNHITEKVSIQTFRQLIQQAEDARQKFLESNLKLVVSITKKHADRENPLLDLIQEGSLPLSKVLDRYEWWKEVKFSGYAWKSIDGHIINYIKENKSLIRVPPATTNRFNKTLARISAGKKRLEQLGVDPTPQELAEAAGIPLKRLQEILAFTTTTNPLSLDKPLVNRQGNKFSAKDLIPTEEESVENQVVRKIKSEEARRVFAEVLTERELTVLYLRFGLEMTQEKVAELLGITRERIGQIERGTLKKLQKPENIKKFENWI